MGNNAIQENMNYNEHIMLAVFEKFLNTRPVYLQNDSATRHYINNFLADLSSFDSALVQWHIAILFDEFLIKQDIINAVFSNWRLGKSADHLNRNGQELCESLQKKYRKIIQ